MRAHRSASGICSRFQRVEARSQNHARMLFSLAGLPSVHRNRMGWTMVALVTGGECMESLGSTY